MKKKAIGLVIAIGLIGGFISSALGDQPQTDATDSPLTQEVAHQGEVLENHEGRITNTEKDVNALQNSTGTAPASDRVVVREVSPAPQPAASPSPTPAPAPAPQPEPIVVTSYQQIAVENEGTDCKLTYSDGTTYQWHWQTVEYNQGTKITKTSGACNDSVIGQRKG